MQPNRPHYTDFRRRLRNGEHLVGTFIKFPSTHCTEIIGGLGFDFVVIDAEHSPFDRLTIDALALAARASNVAALVRISEPTPAGILSVLDVGCIGVLVPHCSTAKMTREIVAACRYRGGNRGYASTNRGGNWGGNSMKKQMDEHDERVACVAMIEDPHALAEIDEITATPGLDAIFIGRGDLTAALQADSPKSGEVMEVVEQVAASARRNQLPVIVLASNRDDAVAMASLGATAFVNGSDQGFIKKGALETLKTLSGPIL